MNFLKRAVMSITRKKGRTLIMFVILVTVANLVLAGLAIQHATKQASVLAREKLGGQLTLRYNMQRAIQRARAEGANGFSAMNEPITSDMITEIAKHESIINYNYYTSVYALAEGVEPVSTGEQVQNGNADSNGQGGNRGRLNMLPQNPDFVMPDFSIVGVVATELLDAFNNAEDKLVAGKHISTEEKKSAVIEKNLAEQNSLSVGDKINLKSTTTEAAEEFAIVGIYETASTGAQGQRMRSMPFMQPYNRIYIDYESSAFLQPVSEETGEAVSGIDTAVFYVDDPENIDKVKEAAKQMNIDWEKFVLDANDSAFRQMMGPIENVAAFSRTVVYIVAVAGATILGLMFMLSVKERMYETGVLLSMGEGKTKVIAQYISEVLIIAVLAFGLSSISGGYIAQKVSDGLIEREVTLAAQQGFGFNGMGNPNASLEGGGQFRRSMEGRFQMGANRGIEPIKSIGIEISRTEITQLILAGLFIIIFATMLPAITIMRYKPKAILTKAI